MSVAPFSQAPSSVSEGALPVLSETVHALGEQWRAMSALELLAVVLAVAYLLLVIRRSIWCWPCAFFSTAIYVYLFHSVALLMESALNVFYLAMAVYGWVKWRGGISGEGASIVRWRCKTHAVALIAIALLSIVSGALLSRYFSPAFPYLDSLTTWSAVWATFLVARKELTNWIYWFGIDLLSVFLYVERGLMLTALLFVFYIVLIPFGWRSWHAQFQRERSLAA